LFSAGVLLIGQAVRFLSFEPERRAPKIVPVGKPADFPKGTVTYTTEVQAYIGHDDMGLYALDAVCTHLGCLVERTKGGGFSCPCHGSHFDPHGVVEEGPATEGLHHLRLFLDGEGRLMVDRSQVVDPFVRLLL
jgi:cytochrome b6-f complex iron-sulfur subunit